MRYDIQMCIEELSERFYNIIVDCDDIYNDFTDEQIIEAFTKALEFTKEIKEVA